MLEIRELTKTYGDKVALNHMNLELKEGIYGILGANGAGKSTLMNLITDNIERESGSILFDGKEILSLGEEYRKEVGYMPQQQGFYDDFTARVFLLYMAELKGLKRKEAKEQVEHLLRMVNLSAVANKRIGGFSGGMKQRVLLAQALLGSPKILILDEPTAGLDPKERIHIRNFISELSKEHIILLATHVVSDIECIADQVLLMKNGNLVVQGTPKELLESLDGKVAEIRCEKEEIGAMQEKYRIGNIMQRKDGMVLRVVGDHFSDEFTVVRDNLTLEDVYMYYFEYLE